MAAKTILATPTGSREIEEAAAISGDLELESLPMGSRILNRVDEKGNRVVTCEYFPVAKEQIFVQITNLETHLKSSPDRQEQDLGYVEHRDHWGASLAIPMRMLIDRQTAECVVRQFIDHGVRSNQVHWVEYAQFSDVEAGLPNLFDPPD